MSPVEQHLACLPELRQDCAGSQHPSAQAALKRPQHTPLAFSCLGAGQQIPKASQTPVQHPELAHTTVLVREQQYPPINCWVGGSQPPGGGIRSVHSKATSQHSVCFPGGFVVPGGWGGADLLPLGQQSFTQIGSPFDA
jgi:hypothetical protein